MDWIISIFIFFITAWIIFCAWYMLSNADDFIYVKFKELNIIKKIIKGSIYLLLIFLILMVSIAIIYLIHDGIFG